MPPPTNALDRLAPDQRAAVELVLRQGRSYGELANVLGLPEDTIRARTRGGLEALAPDLPPPPRAGEVADWLLGQQAEAHAARTRELVAGDPATRRWAETVAEPLRELAGDALPAVPSAPERPPRGVNGAGGRGAAPARRRGARRGGAAPGGAPPPRGGPRGGAGGGGGPPPPPRAAAGGGPPPAAPPPAGPPPAGSPPAGSPAAGPRGAS